MSERRRKVHLEFAGFGHIGSLRWWICVAPKVGDAKCSPLGWTLTLA